MKRQFIETQIVKAIQENDQDRDSKISAGSSG